MNRQTFGKTGIEIPPIVFGTSNLGNLFQELPLETKREIIKEWFKKVDSPIVIDTAGKYGAGLALEVLGTELAALGIRPEQVVISNKLGWRRVPLVASEPTFEPGAWFGLEHDAVQDISYDGILRCWDEGNELLGDYPAQLASVHDPDEYLAGASSTAERTERLDHILSAYRALGELKEMNLVAGIGVGSKDWTIIQEISRLVPLDWVMIANSFTIYQHPPELLDFISHLAADGIGIINSAVYHSGFLVGGSHFDYRPVTDPALFAWRDSFQEICREFGVQPADACVSFAMAPDGIQAIALSSSNPARVAKNVASVTAEIPDEFWKALEQAALITASPIA